MTARQLLERIRRDAERMLAAIEARRAPGVLAETARALDSILEDERRRMDAAFGPCPPPRRRARRRSPWV